MKVGFYAGSFDPFTIGHLEVLKKASEIFDKLIVGIGFNPDKKRRFNEQEMKTAIEKVLMRENLISTEVVVYDGLTVDAAKKCEALFLIRGIRNAADYAFEENLASINEEISGLDTIYIRAGEYNNVSSSFVYELLKNGKDVSKYLPEEILKIVQKNIKN